MVNQGDTGLPAIFSPPKSMSKEAARRNRYANAVINPGEIETGNRIEEENEE